MNSAIVDLRNVGKTFANGVVALERLDLAEWLPQHLISWSDTTRGNDVQMDNSVSNRCWIEAQPLMFAELVNNLLDISKMEQGRMTQVDAPYRLYDRPASAFISSSAYRWLSPSGSRNTSKS